MCFLPKSCSTLDKSAIFVLHVLDDTRLNLQKMGSDKNTFSARLTLRSWHSRRLFSCRVHAHVVKNRDSKMPQVYLTVLFRLPVVEWLHFLLTWNFIRSNKTKSASLSKRSAHENLQGRYFLMPRYNFSNAMCLVCANSYTKYCFLILSECIKCQSVNIIDTEVQFLIVTTFIEDAFPVHEQTSLI